jgi:hypothetical protein
MSELYNQMKTAAAAVNGLQGQSRWGVITSSRQTDTGYEVRVTYQPENIMTGWLPVLSPMVGSGWGLVSPPAQGMQAFVIPDSGFGEHGVVAGMAFSRQAMPPTPGNNPVKPGQFALMHQNGSYLHFNDDDVLLVTNRDLQATVGRNATVNVSQDATVSAGQDISASASRNATVSAANVASVTAGQHINLSAPSISGDADGKGGKGTWSFQGDLFVNGQVSDFHGSLNALRSHYDAHTHTDTHGDTTGLPTPQD